MLSSIHRFGHFAALCGLALLLNACGGVSNEPVPKAQLAENDLEGGVVPQGNRDRLVARQPVLGIHSRRQFRRGGRMDPDRSPGGAEDPIRDRRRDGRPGARARQGRHRRAEKEEKPHHCGPHALRPWMNGR